ncbi:uncharacterized protein G2W53_018334 [Senna tora]|uniref:Uncharacterized protein n=1 Tax=Senna tora TaxID=362788 RepID=A0A834TVR9_9FABA|nr:uncharacterized protein G2W53_018334 [Senna tora]
MSSGKQGTKNRNCRTSMSISRKTNTWMQMTITLRGNARHGYSAHDQQLSSQHIPQKMELKRKREVEQQPPRKMRRWYELGVAKCNVEKIGQPIVNLVKEDVNVGSEGRLGIREEERRIQRKRSGEIRLVSLGLYILGEGINVPFSKRRKKYCLDMEKNWVQRGVNEKIESVSAVMKGFWEASLVRPPIEG